MRRKSHVRFGERGGENRTEQSAHGVPAPTPRACLPTTEDIECTRNLVKVGKLMDIPIIDHLVIGHNNLFTSLKREKPEIWTDDKKSSVTI